MTISEVRKTKEYAKMINKVRSYPVGSSFKLDYASIPTPQGNALKIVTKDCIEEGILESVSFDLDFNGNCTSETYRRV